MDDPNTSSLFALPNEYAMLADPQQVMREVVTLLGDLRRATLHLGDALESVGLSARAWRTEDAWLDLLSERLPALTLDDFLSHFMQFAADDGLRLLQGDERDIAAFGEQIDEWRNQAQTMRIMAHRLRLAGVHIRQGSPLTEALARPSLSAPLDHLLATLSDLNALQPFLIPLTQREWETFDLTDALDDMLPDDMPPDTLARLRANAPAAHEVHSAEAILAAPQNERASVIAQPQPTEDARQSSQSFRRLRDFAAPPPAVVAPAAASATRGGVGTGLSGDADRLIASLPVGLRAPVRWAFTHRLTTTLLVIVALALGLGVVHLLAYAFPGR